jgi:anti-sigma factor RsiW
MNCDETLNTQALFDGALDDRAAAAAQHHADNCEVCRRLLAELGSMRGAIRDEAVYYRADRKLRARLGSALAAEGAPRVARLRPRSHPFWWGLLNGALVTAAAAALAIFLLSPAETDELVSNVTSAHVRSLIGAHLIDFRSSDPNEVKHWLVGHTGLSSTATAPPPAEFRLEGARADYVYGSVSAVTIYRSENHVVNVFAWRETEDEALSETASHGGYNIVFWKKGRVVFCAVSNVALEQLKRLARSLEATSG